MDKLFALTIAGVLVLTAIPAGAEGVRPQGRSEIHPVIVTARQITEINRQMQNQHRGLQRDIATTPKLGVHVFGKAGSDPRLLAKLNASLGTERGFGAPSPSPVVPAYTVLGVNFLGLRDNEPRVPPDTHGAVGPSHVMAMLNTQVHIQDKTGVDVSGWPVNLEAFWASTGAGDFFYDPRIIYDSSTGRWLATVLSEFGVHLAIHSGPDPSVGSWSFFTIAAYEEGALYPDFPDIGCNLDWIALTANIIDEALESTKSAMWVIERPVPLEGPAVVHTFPAGFDSAGGAFGLALRPCLTFDNVDTLYIVDNTDFVDGETGLALLRLSRVTGPADEPVWSVQPSSAHGPTGLFTVPDGNDFFYDPPEAAQLGSQTRISTNTGQMLEAVFRNGHVWCTHQGGFPVPANSQCSVFWYELAPRKMPAPIVQAGVIDGGTDVHHFFPSLAVDASDNMVIGFTRSHQGIYAQGVFTGRDAYMAPGMVGPIQVLKAGEDNYERKRWGDYSATVVDPVDDTFWTLQEYAAGPGQGRVNRWGTWWGQIEVIVPVQFQSLDADVIDGAVELSWEILGDEPLAGFDVYRKEQGGSDEFTVVSGDTALAPEARLFIDDSVMPEAGYVYQVSAIKQDGEQVRSPLVSVNVPAVQFSLSQNYPNPFHQSTTIEFTLPEAERVTFSVYDPRGRLVVSWSEDVGRGGRHAATWDGRDGDGDLVGSGVYFCTLEAGHRVSGKKMIFLK
jgi:hypothetical protein